jgi:hypothetical protein
VPGRPIEVAGAAAGGTGGLDIGGGHLENAAKTGTIRE